MSQFSSIRMTPLLLYSRFWYFLFHIAVYHNVYLIVLYMTYGDAPDAPLSKHRRQPPPPYIVCYFYVGFPSLCSTLIVAYHQVNNKKGA